MNGKTARHSGFSLIEVLIAIAVMTILGLALLDMNQNLMKGQNSVTLQGKVNNLGFLIADLMRNNLNNCSANFAGLTFNANPATLSTQVVPLPQIAIPGPPPTTLVALSQQLAPNLKITKLELTGFTVSAPGAQYEANIYIEATAAAGSFMGAPVLNTSVSIPLTTQYTSPSPPAPPPYTVKITGCSAANIVCPAGWSLVGNGSADSFCISGDTSSANLFPAAAQCATLNSHLCSSEEWLFACNTLTGFDSATPQWVGPIYTGCGSPGCFDLAGGGGGCVIGGAGGDGNNVNHNYRCCMR